MTLGGRNLQIYLIITWSISIMQMKIALDFLLLIDISIKTETVSTTNPIFRFAYLSLHSDEMCCVTITVSNTYISMKREKSSCFDTEKCFGRIR